MKDGKLRLFITNAGNKNGIQMIKVLKNYPELEVYAGASFSDAVGFFMLEKSYCTLLKTVDSVDYLYQLERKLVTRDIDFILPMDDREMFLVSSFADYLQEKYSIFTLIPSLETLYSVDNKWLLYSLLKDKVPFTPTYPVCTIMTSSYNFPMVLKPLTGKSKKDICYIYNNQHLIQVLQRSQIDQSKYILQENLPGDEVRLYTLFDFDGELQESVMEVRRQGDKKKNNIEKKNLNYCIRMCLESILGYLNFIGGVCFCFKYNENKELLLYDIKLGMNLIVIQLFDQYLKRIYEKENRLSFKTKPFRNPYSSIRWYNHNELG